MYTSVRFCSQSTLFLSHFCLFLIFSLSSHLLFSSFPLTVIFLTSSSQYYFCISLWIYIAHILTLTFHQPFPFKITNGFRVIGCALIQLDVIKFDSIFVNLLSSLHLCKFGLLNLRIVNACTHFLIVFYERMIYISDTNELW